MALGDLVSKLTSSGQDNAVASANEGAGKCPNCTHNLYFKKGEKTVVCNCCDQVIDVDDIVRGSGAPVATQQASFNVASIAMSIDSPESGLVYVDNFFANYDWDAYKTVSVIGIEEIDGMVEKNKIKNGANSAAWVLDFESKIVPLTKKIEGISEFEGEMVSAYDPVDNTVALESFDVYARIIHTVIDNREAIVKQLSNDIEYAKKFGADASTCESMSARLNALKSSLDALVLPAKLDDVPAIKAAKEEINKKIVKELAGKGIDAASTYRAAVEIFESHSSDKSRALELFESIRGYADSSEYVERINKFFNYNYNLFAFFGKHYIFKEDKAAAFNPNDKGDDKAKGEGAAPAEEESIGMPSFSLYEVLDGEPAKEPLFKGLTMLLTCYSNKLFYISKNKKICCYDVHKHEGTVIDEGKSGAYEAINKTNNFFPANDGKAFFMRKKLSLIEAKTGCFASIKSFFASLFGKKKATVVRKDNYSIVYIDMVANTAKTLVDELIDITEYYGNNLFYITADKTPSSEATYFMVCDVTTGESQKILDDSCEIHNVVDNKVVYSLWTPNDYNKDLYVLDLESGEKTLIEKNIYDYFATIKGRIFYTIGNDYYCPLFSNNTEGTDRLEIMQNVAKIEGVRGGWMYIVKGSGRNTALVKMSADGKQTYVVCTQLKEIVEFTDSYIYYIDTSSVLHVVRNDGQDNRVIASGMTRENIIVGYDAIYYLRAEAITPSRNAYSLYKMDLSGHNSRKLIFNVNSFKDYDKDTLYLMRRENVRFEITTPISAKETVTDYKKYNVTRYFKFDKNTEEITTVLSLGLPKTDKFEYKSGCLKKKVEAESSFREVPDKSDFKRNNIALAGSVYNTQVAEAEANKK